VRASGTSAGGLGGFRHIDLGGVLRDLKDGAARDNVGAVAVGDSSSLSADEAGGADGSLNSGVGSGGCGLGVRGGAGAGGGSRARGRDVVSYKKLGQYYLLQHCSSSIAISIAPTLHIQLHSD
jgi:hypothetical protein